jgi:hypothetical protein
VHFRLDRIGVERPKIHVLDRAAVAVGGEDRVAALGRDPHLAQLQALVPRLLFLGHHRVGFRSGRVDRDVERGPSGLALELLKQCLLALEPANRLGQILALVLMLLGVDVAGLKCSLDDGGGLGVRAGVLDVSGEPVGGEQCGLDGQAITEQHALHLALAGVEHG